VAKASTDSSTTRRSKAGCGFNMRLHEANEFTGGEKVYFLKIGEMTICPWGKVCKRVINGKEDDVWFYYQAMKSQIKQRNNNKND
jgi:hypothetical protein